jgi:hypothetical protein
MVLTFLPSYWIFPYHRISTDLLRNPRLQLIQRLFQSLSFDRVPQTCAMCVEHPLEAMRWVFDLAVADYVAHFRREKSEGLGSSYHCSKEICKNYDFSNNENFGI